MSLEKKHRRTLLNGVLVAAGLGVAPFVQADITLTPADADWTSPKISNLQQSDVEALVGTSPLTLAYKQDFGGNESGFADAYYSTEFVMEGTGDASGAIITSDGPQMLDCPSCFLVVKNGNHPEPNYLFDIGNWNGTETITLSGFWESPNQGAMSNIAIWSGADGGGGGGGGGVVPIPEAQTYAMMLAGLGLVGFMAARRKRL